MEKTETNTPTPVSIVSGDKPFAYAHPTGAIWRLDNYPAGMDFENDGWFPLYRNAAKTDPLREALQRIIREDDTGPMIYDLRENAPSQAIGGSEGKFAAIARAALSATATEGE